MNNSLQDQPYQLIIDTEQISKSARSDEQLVSLLSNSVNYFPQFAFLSSITGVLDLASVGLIGTKTGFSRFVGTI